MDQGEVNMQIEGELRPPTLPSSPGAIATPIPGVVTQQIGSGEHAQNSIVYRTILWSFIGGGLLSVAAVLMALRDGSQSPMSEIKEIWSIFAPLITLALGYVFGKGR
ncbi:hypothetical protein [Cupriavidus taiwanensis]|uniref:hypothetical protein n=1 Tax=Cupriavidus taiwanensis TaxID=164546 RepID=UPI000E2EEA00|nr:hypothetical protein [Cupriavidus taiwanensis]